MTAVYITWTDTTADPEPVYVGGGVTATRWINHRTITKRALYSSDVSGETIARAKRYVASDMGDRPNVKVVVE